jgi:LysM repeat protein
LGLAHLGHKKIATCQAVINNPDLNKARGFQQMIKRSFTDDKEEVMKTINRKLVTLIVCAILLLLPACAPASGGLSLKGADPTIDIKTGLEQWGTDILARTGVSSDVQERPLAINYSNCVQLYAVQPGDTLEDVARVSATTEEFVLSRNDLESADDLYPGQVLCLEDGNGDGGIPVTGGERSGVEVTSVSTDQTVTVRGINFPDGEGMNVYIFQQGVSNPNVVFLGAITIPSGGTFEREFQIPPELRSFRDLVIRFRNPDENISSTATFINADVDRVTPDECAEYYIVRSGDSLGLIAQEVNVTVERLVALNNLLNASVVFPGQMLCIDLE